MMTGECLAFNVLAPLFGSNHTNVQTTNDFCVRYTEVSSPTQAFVSLLHCVCGRGQGTKQYDMPPPHIHILWWCLLLEKCRNILRFPKSIIYDSRQHSSYTQESINLSSERWQENRWGEKQRVCFTKTPLPITGQILVMNTNANHCPTIALPRSHFLKGFSSIHSVFTECLGCMRKY